MKIPLRYGLLLLGGLLILSAFVGPGPEKSVVLVAAMASALWTAFSLPAPPKKEEEEDTGGIDMEEQPLDGTEKDMLNNKEWEENK